MTKIKIAAAMLSLIALSRAAQASEKVIRATEMGSSVWSDLARGKWVDGIVEFRQGDELPVALEAQGDLLETKQSAVSTIAIKRNFWLRLHQNQVEISMDGSVFKKLGDVLSGTLEAGAGSAQNGGLADAINIAFKAYLK